MSLFIPCFMLGVFGWADGRVEIVSYDRRTYNAEFHKYTERFPISITDAWRLIEEDAYRSGDPILMGRVEYMKIEGIVNDEYVFVNPLDRKKTRFAFFGYHVNVHTGAVRYLRRKDIKFEYDGLFPDGYGHVSKIKRYYIPLK